VYIRVKVEARASLPVAVGAEQAAGLAARGRSYGLGRAKEDPAHQPEMRAHLVDERHGCSKAATWPPVKS
jgi:hypothetical protein